MIVPVLHVALQIGLCSAITKQAPEAPVAIHVRLIDSSKHSEFDKVFTVQRGYDATRTVEFDTERGVYHLLVDVPKFHCSARDYPAFMSDVDRNTLTETLVGGIAPDPHPVLINGSMPQSFADQEPAFVFLDKKATGCNQPVGDVLPGSVKLDYDQQAFYAALLPDPGVNAHAPVYIALRLRTPHKEYHYIRVPYAFPEPWLGWPTDIRMNLPEGEFLSVARDPVDTLLCPKFIKTSVS